MINMIKINLLPQDMSGGKGAVAGEQSSGAMLVVLILVFVFGANAALAGYLYMSGNEASRRLVAVEAEHKEITEKLNKQQVTFRANNASLERMKRLISVAEQLDPPERVLWARKLNMLPMLVPDGVFLTELNVTQQSREVETPESIKRRNEWSKKKTGPQPEVERIRNIQQTLLMSGIAYVADGSDNQRLQQINTFYRNLQSKPVKLPFDQEEANFMVGFAGRPDVASAVTTQTFDGRQVSSFSFSLKTKPLQVN